MPFKSEVQIACSGLQHRVAVRGWELVLLDHDLDAERVAHVLSGAAPACVVLHDAWTNLDLDSLKVFYLQCLLAPETVDGPHLQRIREVMDVRRSGGIANLVAMSAASPGIDKADLPSDEVVDAMQLQAARLLVLMDMPPALGEIFRRLHLSRARINGWTSGSADS